MLHSMSASQLRAARALLNWSRIDLAEQSGVSEPTIHRFENNMGEPELRTQKKLLRVFEENGVEFMDNSGVRLKPQGVEVLIGREGQHQFFNNVHDYMRMHGGEIVQLGIDEDQFVRIAGNEFAKSYNKRMTDLVRERKDIQVLAILREGDTNFTFLDYNQYRWISKDIFAPVPFYIYGDILAIMDFQTVPPPTIIVHKFPAIAQAYRKQFDVFWKIAKEPPKK